MIICSVNQIDKMYGANPVLKSITFEIHENSRVGLVGRNGSGKTTLMQILSSEEPPDNGEIHFKKGCKIGYLEQIPNTYDDFKTKSVLKTAFSDLLKIEEKIENLEILMSKEEGSDNLNKIIDDYGLLQEQFALGGGYEIESHTKKVVNGIKIFDLLEKNFSELSGGEKTKVSLALVLLKNPEFLLLDEPTNHLDLDAVEWLGKFLQDYKGTVILVSHDRYFLDEVVNRILDMEDGEINSYKTNYSDFLKEKEDRLLREFSAYKEQQKKIKKMKESIKRLREWANNANPPSESLYKRAKNMERALERMQKLSSPKNRKKLNLEISSTERSGNDVIMIQSMSMQFGNQQLFNSINMDVKFQQKAAIVGGNGTGKSTIIKLILNQFKADKGLIRIGSNVKIGYLSQDFFSEDKDETVIESFRNTAMISEAEARHILAKFLFYGPMVFRKVSQLSGGEKMRIRLAQIMYQDTNLLILDEPTNHLDIESREVLEDALEEYDGTVLAVSHDRYFLNKLFNKTIWIDNKGVHSFDGNYNYAKEKMESLVLNET